jgi:hypothetical protein
MTHLQYASDAQQIESRKVVELLNKYENALKELSSLIASIERKVRAHGKAKPNAVREELANYMAD